MKKYLAVALSLVAIVVGKEYKYAGPWLTGPIIASPGHALAPGEVNWQFYLFVTDYNGIYNNRWHAIAHSGDKTITPLSILGVGLWKNWDIHLTWPVEINFNEGVRCIRSGDLSIELGWQVSHAKMGRAIPDIRLTVSESFTTGQYQRLRAVKKRTDIGGSGSYSTDLGIKFQKLWRTFGQQFLSMRLNIDYTFPLRVRVHGLNAYGGAPDTNAIVRPGHTFTTVISAEQTVVRRWALAMDAMYTHTRRTTYTGDPGTGSDLSQNSVDQYSLAPAIEYNPNGNLGFIAGVWFTLAGKNAANFTTFAISCTFGY